MGDLQVVLIKLRGGDSILHPDSINFPYTYTSIAFPTRLNYFDTKKIGCITVTHNSTI
jgi:hypothetical protein